MPHRKDRPGSRTLTLLGLLLPLVAARPALAGLTPSDVIEPRPDTTYARLVRGYTTDPRFLTDPVAVLPDDAEIPSPREFLGYVVGAPGKLTYYSDVKAYLEMLSESSPRVALQSMGRSNEGREMIVVFIAEDGVIRSLERYAGYTRRLSDPRETDADAAREIVDLGLPFYYLCGGLHSTETGSPEMLMELAYRLAVGESPLVRRIRENVITMITPVLETDGRERMADWYYNVTVDYDTWEDMPMRYPPYWGKYVFHDNNRDGLQATQPLTRNFADIFFQYHPQVVHDLHESVPLLYVSSGTGPYNDSLDPIVTSEWQWIANQEVSELTKLGLPGVWTWGFYTGWYPGYLMWIANNHNSIGRFYETFGNAGASTFERKLESKFAGRKVTTREWYRPWPPEKKVEWSFRNTINYMESGALVALDFCARNGRSLLYNYWKKGDNAVERGRTEAPFAYVIPREGANGFELSRLVETLRGQRIEVHTLDEAVRLDGTSFARGDYVVRLDQPYGDFARSLLEPQHFPEDAPYTPYDDVAWTLPLLYGVDANRVDNDAVFGARMSPVDGPVHSPGDSPRKSPAYVIPATASATTLAARYRLGDAEVYAADTSFTIRGREYPRGSWLISGGDADALHKAVVAVAETLGLDVDGVRALPDTPRHALDLPRIAIFHTWFYTQDSGWMRYTFDRWSIPYTLINKDDIRDGNLRDYYDVILVPDTGGWTGAAELIHGVDGAYGPIPYPAGTAAGGAEPIDTSDDITGGMGFSGLAEIEHFVDAGGTLITFGAASIIPADLGIAPHLRHVHPSGFANPGSVVRARVVDPASPIVAGYDEVTSVFRGNSPVIDVDDWFRDRYTVMQYGTKLPGDDTGDDGGEASGDDAKPLCLSGMVKGAKQLEGKPAILDIPRGEGRVIVYTFNPVHRFLNISDFGLAFNAILNWND